MNPLAPTTLDGASVLAYADVAGTKATGRTRHVVAGIERSDFAYLAIAQYREGYGYYLFYCDEDWGVVNDTFHDSREAAEAQASFEFEGVTFNDVQASP